MKRFIFIILVLAAFCKKSTSHCETWQIQDACIPKTEFSWCLIDQSVRESVFCNNDLVDVYAGKVEVLLEDENYTQTRTYIKKIR